MSQLMFDHVGSLLQKVSQDLRQMHDETTGEIDKIMGALDDIAANVLAVEAVVGTMAKKYPVDLADVQAWLKAHLVDSGEVSKAEAMAEYLVTGKRPE